MQSNVIENLFVRLPQVLTFDATSLYMTLIMLINLMRIFFFIDSKDYFWYPTIGFFLSEKRPYANLYFLGIVL